MTDTELRDKIALTMLPTLLAMSYNTDPTDCYRRAAKNAYALADEMLVARNSGLSPSP